MKAAREKDAEPRIASMRRYACTSQWAKARTTARGKLLPACVPPTAFANGSALVFYNSTTYRDDMTWAAAWMYKATGEPVRFSIHAHPHSAHCIISTAPTQHWRCTIAPPSRTA